MAWQVKRMRATLFETLISQDVSFFDRESVGDLTSRLGSDAQSVSHIISIDLNIILRNTLQASPRSRLCSAGGALQESGVLPSTLSPKPVTLNLKPPLYQTLRPNP